MHINAVCCFDDNLSIQAMIMAASIASHASPTRPVTLHAFYLGDISAVDLEKESQGLKSSAFELKPRRLANPFSGEFRIAAANPSYYLRLAILGHVHVADKLIYLDVDTLVKDSLADLFDTDLHARALAACADFGLEQTRLAPRTAKNIFMSSIVMRDYVERVVGSENRYINSGILVVDVPRWIEMGITNKCLHYIENASHLLFADQDALNYVLQGDVTLLDQRWNCIPMYQKGPADLANAGIVHYAGIKPWKTSDLDQMGDKEYWDFAMSTPYGRRLRARQIGELKYLQRTGVKRLPSAFEVMRQTLLSMSRHRRPR